MGRRLQTQNDAEAKTKREQQHHIEQLDGAQGRDLSAKQQLHKTCP